MIFTILAGGLGTRLRNVVGNTPKPMAAVNGRPFLEYLLSHLARSRPDGFILCVSHLREKIISHFGRQFLGIPIAYSIEEVPLGTGGAIKQACTQFSLDRTLAVNGDTFIDADYGQFIAHCANASLGVMLTQIQDASRYGKVRIHKGHILAFEEKKPDAGPGLINAGAYVLSSSLLTSQPAAFSFESEFLAPYVSQLKPAFHLASGQFIDIGTPESYARAASLPFAHARQVSFP